MAVVDTADYSKCMSSHIHQTSAHKYGDMDMMSTAVDYEKMYNCYSAAAPPYPILQVRSANNFYISFRYNLKYDLILPISFVFGDRYLIVREKNTQYFDTSMSVFRPCTVSWLPQVVLERHKS